MLAAEAVNKSPEVVRYKPGVLPSVAFAVVVRAVGGSERTIVLSESALAVLASEEVQFVVKKVDIGFASVLEMLPVSLECSLFACPGEMSCGIGKCAVCKCIFKVIGYGFIEEVAWDVTIFHPQVLASVRSCSRSLHCLHCEFVVYIVEAFYNGVSHRRDARIADHAVSLAAMQVPYRKFSLFLIDGEHSVDEVCISFRLEYAVQRHGCPVCIPKRECRIGRIAGISVYCAVGSSISTINIAECRRSDHCVVEGCVENLLCVLVPGLDMYS